MNSNTNFTEANPKPIMVLFSAVPCIWITGSERTIVRIPPSPQPHINQSVSQAMNQFQNQQGDLSTKRNAFLMLLNCDMERAVQFLLTTQDSVPTSGDLFQLAVLELIRKACRANSAASSAQQNKSKLLRVLYNLADPSLSNSMSSTAVAYDVASSLVQL